MERPPPLETRPAAHGRYMFDNINPADTAFMILATTFVFIQTPAMGIAQAGLLRRKNVLSMITQTMVGVCVGSLLFALVGFSLLWGPTLGGAGLIGSPWHYPMLMGVKLNESTPKLNAEGAPLHSIPEITYAAFQMMFALMTPVIVTGAWAEKFTMYGFLTFVVVWPLFVYYPLAHWCWNPEGWMARWGVQDFAGGMVIHTSSGFSGLVVAGMLRHRRYKESASRQQHNLPLFAVGSFFVWAGWYFFNGGSACSAGAQAATAMINTHLAACTGSFFWMCASYADGRKFRLGYFTNGAFAGLGGITAGSGYVAPQGAVCIGLAASAASYAARNWVQRSKRFDDVLDCFALQGAPGVVGSILVGVFGVREVGGADGLAYGGDVSFVGKQVAAVAVTAALSGAVTWMLIAAMRWGLGERFGMLEVDDVEDAVGLDLSQIGEAGYDGSLFDDENKVLLADKLCNAVLAGDFAQYVWLKETVYDAMTGMHIGQKNRAGRTAFHAVACSPGLFWTSDAAQKAALEEEFRTHDPASPCMKWLAETSEAVKVVNALLDHKCNVNEADNFKHTPLQYVLDRQGDPGASDLEKRHMTALAAYLKSKGGLTCPDAAGSRLNAAVKDADLAVLQVVLSLPGVVDICDYDLRTPLHIATEEWVQAAQHPGAADDRRALVVKFLLFNNANRHARDRWGCAPIDLARSAIVRNAATGPRAVVAHRRLQDIERCLLVSDPAAEYHEMFTAGLALVSPGSSSLDTPPTTPTRPLLRMASSRWAPGGRPTSLEYLPAAAGCLSPPLSPTPRGLVPVDVAEQALSYAASVTGRGPLERLALQGPQYASIRDAHGLSLLHVACMHGVEDIVDWLLAPPPLGINAVSLMAAADAHGHTPMYTAVTACHPHDHIPRTMQARYRELHDGKDWPPDERLGYVLCRAAKENNKEFLNALVVAGAPVADCDFGGRTALHLAVCEAHEGLVKWLMAQDPRGQALATFDKMSHTPLDDARAHKAFAARSLKRQSDSAAREAYATARRIYNLLAAAARHRAPAFVMGGAEGAQPAAPPPMHADHPYKEGVQWSGQSPACSASPPR